MYPSQLPVAVGGFVLLIIILSILAKAFRTVQAYEVGLVVRFGKVISTREPGLRLLVPYIDKLIRQDMRVSVLTLPPQSVVTKDSVSATVQAAVYYRLSDPTVNYVNQANNRHAVTQLGQAILRRILGQHSLDEILGHSETLVEALQRELERGARDWGITITQIALNDVGLPESMVRAMATKAEAEREADAKVTAAQGEFNAARLLQDAANLLDGNGLELRRLQTWALIGAENATVIVVSGSEGALAAQAAAGTAAMLSR